jgi:DNA-binding NarL/FixJ family response regulator
MKRVVIADDQKILREGLKALLAGADSFEVVAETDSSMELIRCVEEHQPDLLLLNLSLLSRGGRSVIKKIKNRFPGTKIVAFGTHASEEFMIEGLQLGADGYCLKDCGRTELMTAIERVLAGKTYLSPDIAERLLDGIMHGRRGLKRLSPFGSLTLREKEVLTLVGQGYQTKKIAQYLLISPKTVEKHRSNIARKLDIHNASRLTVYAIEKGLVPARGQGGRPA